MCEQAFQVHNTAQQNSHCLHNFDLSEYRQILSDLAVWIFQGLVKLNGALIHSLIGQCTLSTHAQYIPLTLTRLNCRVAHRHRWYEHSSQVAHDDCRWIRSTVCKLTKPTPQQFDYVHFDRY